MNFRPFPVCLGVADNHSQLSRFEEIAHVGDKVILITEKGTQKLTFNGKSWE